MFKYHKATQDKSKIPLGNTWIPLDTCKLLVKGILWFWVSGLCGILQHRSVNIFSGLAIFFGPGTCYPQDGYLNCQVGFNWSNHLYRAQKRMFGHVLCLCEFLKHLSWHSSRTTELEDPTNLDLKQFCWSRDFRWLLVHGWIYGHFTFTFPLFIASSLEIHRLRPSSVLARGIVTIL